MKKILCGVIPVFVLFFCSFGLNAQDSLRLSIKENARKYFVTKDYVQALPLFRELLNAYPKEPEYCFCTGVCLVNLNGDLDEAIRLLRPTAVTDYSPLAWFYLGRALHLYYSFEDAIKAYSKFMLNGKAVDIKNYDVERLIEMCRNGIEFTRTGRPVMVQNVRTIQIEQLPLATEINGSGKLMKKPVEFCSKTDIRNNYRPWMYLPSYTEINEYVYVSGFERGKKNGRQLFRIRNINHETWGIPEPLNETINTKYDEEYPYFDVKTSTLYFSSKGHSSMGGYDIFKSVYDWNTKTWSAPQNLGFPINSPGDDFIYITDELNHSASFVSTRSSTPNQAALYRIRIEQDTTGIRFFTVDEIRKASQLEVENRIENTITVQPVEENTEPSNVDTIFYKPVKGEYNKVLADALLLQVKADSLSRIVRDLRVMAKESPDETNKKQMITEILRSDKEAKMVQRQADETFAEAAKLKPSVDQPKSGDSAIIQTAQLNDITVYQYNPQVTKAVIVTDPPAEKEAPVTGKSSPVQVSDKKDVFSLLEKSPYNDSNPIPKGIESMDGLVYRIQLGVFSKQKPNDAFGGISPVSYEQLQGAAIIKYYAGLFFSLNSVNKALETIRNSGFPDAFVVAFLDGRMISTEKAREIEFSNFKL